MLTRMTGTPRVRACNKSQNNDSPFTGVRQDFVFGSYLDGVSGDEGDGRSRRQAVGGNGARVRNWDGWRLPKT